MSELAVPPVVELLDASAQLQARFLPGANMLCCSLRHRGEELLAQNAGVDAYVERGATMGIPLLYPWANRLAGFRYSVAGRTVEVPHDPRRVALDSNGLPIHGVVGGRIAWELRNPPDRDPRALAAWRRWEDSEPELFEVFPFEHELEYRVELAEGQMRITVTVSAGEAGPVPVAFGFHPYLTLPGLARERWLVRLPAMRPLELDSAQIPSGAGPPVRAREFELDGEHFDDGFDELAEGAAFSLGAGERTLGLAFERGYTCAQVFSPPSACFICFEPMTAPANALRSGDGLRLLEPGERFEAAYVIRIG